VPEKAYDTKIIIVHTSLCFSRFPIIIVLELHSKQQSKGLENFIKIEDKSLTFRIFVRLCKMIQRSLISASYIFMQISISIASDSSVTQRAFKRMIFSANNWSNLVSISPTFHEYLLCMQIPKSPKDSHVILVFLHFWDLRASKMRVKHW
jgi:hypothetical protein